MTATPPTIDCATACVNGCVLGDQCPHREAAKAAVNYIMNTDWETLMQKAEDRVKRQQDPAAEQPQGFDPMAILENYQAGQDPSAQG